MSLGDIALEYLARGLAVVPATTVSAGLCSCQNPDCDAPGKHPRVKWKPYQTKLPTEAEVGRWWRQWPTANICILTGVLSGIIVLDSDPRHGGSDSLHDLGSLPATPHALTGGGGDHYWWQHPGHTVPNAAGLAPGLDLRGDGGYVIAPPSVHASGHLYAWEIGYSPAEIAIAPLPPAVQQLIAAGGHHVGIDATPTRFDPERAILDPIPEGERNDRLARLAGHYASQGMSYHALLFALLGINTELCRPPLAGDEVRAIATSIYEREEQKRRVTVAVTERVSGATNGDIPEADREPMARALWAELHVAGVTDWLLLRGDDSFDYRLYTADDEISLGRDLLNQRIIRTALLNGLSAELLVVAAREWPKRAKALRDTVRVVYAEPARGEDRLAAWLDEWYEQKPPQAVDPKQRGTIIRSSPVYDNNGTLWLRPQALRRWLVSDGHDIDLQAVQKLLGANGWEPGILRAENTTVRAWRHRGELSALYMVEK